MFTRPWTQIDNMIRRFHHVRIVFHHDDGVAQIAQLKQDADQAGRIPAVQPDRGFIQHVTRAHQTRPQTRRQLYPLRFAAGEG